MTKHCISRICLFLLLGAIVNVAVAWGCALFPPVHVMEVSPVSVTYPAAAPAWLAALDSSTPPSRRFMCMVHDGAPGRTQILVATDHQLWNRSEIGWPFRSLAYTREGARTTEPVRNHHALFIGHLRPHADDRGLLFAPLQPLIVGFAANSVMYAAMLWALFAPFGLRGLRRSMRIKRGLCPKCGYDLRGHRGPADAMACPECGAPR